MSEEIRIDQFRTNFWRKVVQEQAKPQLEYDQHTDTLFFYFADPGEGTIVTHYLDQNVSLLFRLSDNEIVGISIEALEKSFADKYTAEKCWKLTSTGIQLEGIKEFKFGIVQQQQAQVDLSNHIKIEKDLKFKKEFAFA